MDEQELLRRLNEHYGTDYRPQGKLILKKGKLFVYTGEDTSLPYDRIGLHIANDDLSLTIEGAQELGTTATRNVVTVSQENAEQYYRGEDVAATEGGGYVILKTSVRIVGPCKIVDKRVINSLPESRKTKR